MQKNKPYKYLEDKGNNNINIKKILIDRKSTRVNSSH